MTINIESICDTETTLRLEQSQAIYKYVFVYFRQEDWWYYDSVKDRDLDVASMCNTFVNQHARGYLGSLKFSDPLAIFRCEVLGLDVAGAYYDNGAFAIERGNTSHVHRLGVSRVTAIQFDYPEPSQP